MNDQRLLSVLGKTWFRRIFFISCVFIVVLFMMTVPKFYYGQITKHNANCFNVNNEIMLFNELTQTKHNCHPCCKDILIRDGTGQDFLDPTGKFQNHRRLTGRSTGFWPARSTGFLKKVFVHCSMYLTQNFFCVFCKNDLILRSFWLSFGLNDLFWAAQNVHKISIKSTGRHKLNY